MSLASRGVAVVLNDGKKRRLRFDINALAAAEATVGPVMEVYQALSLASVRVVRGMLSVGLDDGALDVEEVGELMYGLSLGVLSNQVMEALKDAIEPPEGTPPADPPGAAADATNGSPSTNSSLQPAPAG